jgi:outer membrane receptor protein involved in Fe transport
VALGIELNDSWTVTPSVMAQRQRSSGTFASDPALGDLNVQTYRDDYQNDRWVQAALTVEGQIGNWDLVYSGAYLKRSIDGLTDYSDYAYFYDVLYGYGAYFYSENGGLANPSQYFDSRDRFSLLSQELRISSPADYPLRFVGGIFYQRQSHDIQQQYTVDGIDPSIEVPGWPDTIWLTKQDRVDRDQAIFGELAYDITDELTLTGGLRYFRYNNTLSGFFGYSDGFSSGTGVAACFDAPVPTPGAAPCTNLGFVDASGTIRPRRAKDDGIIHRLNLTYQFTPDHMVYATWSRGFRPGGTNRRGGLFPYRADFLTNYELGLKTTWAGGRFRWNTAIFQEDWKNFQFSILGQNGLTEIRNAAQARIRGIESDIVWRPADGLTITAGFSYIDAELTENYCGFVDLTTGDPVTNCANPPAPAGTRLPASSRFKGNMTARYEFPLNADLEGHVQFAGVYQSSVRSNLTLEDNRLIGTQGGYGTIDIAAGAASEGGWSAELYVTNLLDERGQAYLYAQCAPSICATDQVGVPPGIVYNVPNRPRTFGLRVGRRF